VGLKQLAELCLAEQLQICQFCARVAHKQSGSAAFEIVRRESRSAPKWYSSVMPQNEAEVLRLAQRDAELYTASFLEQLPRAVRDRRRTDRGFCSRINKRWRQAIELFEGVLLLANQLGSEFNHEESADAKQRNDLMFAALVRLHARSCLLCSEVLALLKTGFASGAYARWRTFHETSVTAWFISNGDQLLAEKYLAHQAIKNLEDAEQYQKDCAELGLKPISEEYMKALRLNCEQLKKKYGDAFSGGYGWAAEVVRAKLSSHKGSINFNHLEQAADQSHMRSYYRFASHSIHPTSKGLQYEIGLIRQGEVFLSGPSNYGLAEPANASCSSLKQATTALLMLKPNRQRLASLMALDNMIRETTTAFSKAEQRIVREDSEIRLKNYKSPERRKQR
jgi:hypothetical protein